MSQKGNMLIVGIIIGLVILIGVLMVFNSGMFRTRTSSNLMTSSPTPETTPTMEPLALIQGRCQTGYYLYENDAYSICYPAGWIYEGTKNFGDSAGEVRDQVTFYKDGGKESLDVYPSEEIGATGPNSCDRSEKVNVSGHSASRITIYDSIPGGCSNTSYTNIQTLINGVDMTKMGIHLSAPKYNPFTLNYEVYLGGKPVLTKDQYIIVEQSLQFK